MSNTTESFDVALARFLATTQAVIDEHYRVDLPKLHELGRVTKLEVSPGGVKYVRVVARDGSNGGGSAFCFVERATGNVLKCDGWKRPAPGVRGSIYSPTFEGFGVTVYGAQYAR